MNTSSSGESNGETVPSDGKGKSEDRTPTSTPTSKVEIKISARAEAIEEKAERYFDIFLTSIKDQNPRFLRAQDGSYHMLLGDRRIPINQSDENEYLGRLILKICSLTSASRIKKSVVERLFYHAGERVGKTKFQLFSHISQDQERLYIPATKGKILRISSSGTSLIDNGSSKDQIWLEHTYGKPLDFSLQDYKDPLKGLKRFEDLVVNTQACLIPEMRWLIAMHEGLLPFVKDMLPARAIIVHLGPSQHGKTSGAQRFTLLHGLGEVKGDWSISAINHEGDVGLLVLDNKEQGDLIRSAQLMQYLLYVSTGATWGRATRTGKVITTQARPVVVVTSIEGIGIKQELMNRSIEVFYRTSGPLLHRFPLENAIKLERHTILSSLIAVLREYMVISDRVRKGTAVAYSKETHILLHPISAIPSLEEHFIFLSRLLLAYANVTGKGTKWAANIVRKWEKTISVRELEEDELEQPLIRIMNEVGDLSEAEFGIDFITHNKVKGDLLVTDASNLITLLQNLRIPRLEIPRPNGLTRRLRSAKFQRIIFLDGDIAPDIQSLKRTSTKRPIGIFLPTE